MLDDLLGLADTTYTAGAKLNWNGWLGGFFIDFGTDAKLVQALGTARVRDVRAYKLSDSAFGSDYWKIEATLLEPMTLGQFQEFVQQRLAAAGWSFTTDGIQVDYPGPGSSGSVGDHLDVTTDDTNTQGWWSCVSNSNRGVINCTADSLGVTPTIGALIGAGVVLVGILVLGKIVR